MATFVLLHHGRIKRVRNRSHSHPCGRRRRGRPAVGYGACYQRNLARVLRHRHVDQLRAAIRGDALDDLSLDPRVRAW